MRLARKHKRDLLAECIVQTKVKNSQHFPILVQMFKDEERKRDGYVEPERRPRKERKQAIKAKKNERQTRRAKCKQAQNPEEEEEKKASELD